MIPEDDLVTLPHTSTPVDVEAAVTKHGFSRYLIRNEDSGEITGYVHIKDLLRMGEHRLEEQIPDKRVRGLVTVSADTELEAVLARMQSQGNHLARVYGRSGEVLGVVFLEDILEELVGEVNDTTQRRRFH